MPKSSTRLPTFNHVTDAAPEYVDEILWHRVVLAVAALTLVVSCLGYGLFRLLDTHEQTSPASSSLTLEELTLQEPPAAIPAQSVIESGEPAELASVESTITEEPVLAAEANAVVPMAALNSPGSSEPDSTPHATPVPTDFRVQTTIMVPTVKRAIITDSMRGLEPGRTITDTEFLQGETQYSLYQYVDIRGQAGETLIHHWKRNGKTVAKVRIPVGSDKWRHHSSKNFTPRLEGDWQVDVTNQRGMLLVRSEFHLGE